MLSYYNRCIFPQIILDVSTRLDTASTRFGESNLPQYTFPTQSTYPKSTHYIGARYVHRPNDQNLINRKLDNSPPSCRMYTSIFLLLEFSQNGRGFMHNEAFGDWANAWSEIWLNHRETHTTSPKSPHQTLDRWYDSTIDIMTPQRQSSVLGKRLIGNVSQP